MGESEVTVKEVDPFRGEILVILAHNVTVSVSPGELTTAKPEIEKLRRKRARHAESVKAVIREPEIVHQPEEDQPATTEDHPPHADLNFDFSVYVQSSGSVLKVGSVCFVDSCSSPFIISRIFKSSLGGSVFVSGVRCLCEGGRLFLFCVIFK